MTRSKSQLPALLLAALVSTTVWAGSASAEKGVTLYDHQHRETHTTTRESSTTHTQSSTTHTHSSSSVSVDRTGTAEILGSWLLPNPHRNLPKLRSVSPAMFRRQSVLPSRLPTANGASWTKTAGPSWNPVTSR